MLLKQLRALPQAQVSASELPALSKTLDDREAAIRGGMTVQDTRFEVFTQHLTASARRTGLSWQHVQVHRFHPPLAYGRSMDAAGPEHSEGCALYAASRGPTGCPAFAVITYRQAACCLLDFARPAAEHAAGAGCQT